MYLVVDVIYVDNFIGDFYTKGYSNDLLSSILLKEVDQYLLSNLFVNIIDRFSTKKSISKISVSLTGSPITYYINDSISVWIKTVNNSL